MNKSYTRINWENYPSEDTPVNEVNLNKVDNGLNAVDNNVVTLDAIKLDKTTANDMVKNVSYDNSNGTFTITYLNGSTATLDTKLEKLAVNFTYDSANERLVITLDDGTEQYVDLSSLITEYEFENTSAISFAVEDGKVKANINNGSVNGDMLQPNYLADVTVQAGIAQQGADNAENSAEAAEAAAVRAEAAAEHAEEITNVSIATPSVAGIVKPDDVTIGVDANGKIATRYKIYTALSQINLTAPKTCLEIAKAMPDKSMIILDSSGNVSDTPSSYGTIIIEKQNGFRTPARFITSVGGAIPRCYVRNIRPSDNIISDWTEYLTTSKLTNNLLATVAGTALDATQGKILDDKITAGNELLTNKNILILGDSNNTTGASEQNNWVELFTNKVARLNSTVVNKSENGLSYVGAAQNISNYIPTSGHYDVVVLALGTNDYGGQAQLGTPGTSDTATIHGAVAAILNAMQTSVFDGAVVYGVLPIKNAFDYWDSGSQWLDIPLQIYRIVLTNIYANRNINIINAATEAPLLNAYSAYYNAKYMPDKLHFNRRYSNIYANFIYNKMVSYGDSGIVPIITNHVVELTASGVTGQIVFYTDYTGVVTMLCAINTPNTQNLLVSTTVPEYIPIGQFGTPDVGVSITAGTGRRNNLYVFSSTPRTQFVVNGVNFLPYLYSRSSH